MFNRPQVKSMAWDGAWSLEFWGMTEKEAEPQPLPLGTHGEDKSKGANSQDSSLLSDMSEGTPDCRPQLLDRTLLQPDQVNHLLMRFHSSSLTVPVGPGCPTHLTAELRQARSATF